MLEMPDSADRTVRGAAVPALAVSLAACLSILPLSAAASLVSDFSIEDLVAGSSVIVEGTVESVQPEWNAAHTRIVTRVVIETERIFKGEDRTVVEVFVPGGEVGGLARIVSDVPKFSVGEYVLVFASDRGEGPVVTALSLGKFSIRREKAAGRLVAERDVVGVVPVARRKARARDLAEGRAAKFDYESLRNAIEAYVEGELPHSPALIIDSVSSRAGSKKSLTSREERRGQLLSTAALDGRGVGPGPGTIAVLAVLVALAAAFTLVSPLPHRRLPRGLPALVLAAAVCVLTVFAFTRSVGTAKAYVRWVISGHEIWWDIGPEGSVPVSWEMNLDCTSDTLFEWDVVQNAFQEWEDVPTAEIRFSYAGVPAVECDDFDGHSVIYWATGDPELTGGVLALTGDWADTDTGEILEADLKFNDDDYDWNSLGEGGSEPLEGTALHEIGHFLGLDHPPVPEATMHAYWHFGIETFDQDDVNGVTAIYPDVTSPSAPVITTNGGTDFTQSSQHLTLEGTMPGDTWVLKVNGSTDGVFAFNFGDTLWRFDTVLTTTAAHTFDVTAVDATWNQSAPGTIVVTFQTGGPVITGFSISDYTSADTAYSDEYAVAVSIDAFDASGGTIVRWLLKEDPAAPDVTEMTDNGYPAAPAAYALDGNGIRTLCFWVMDDDDNVSDAASTSIEVNATPLCLLPDAEPIDQTHVLVRYSEPVSGAGTPVVYSLVEDGTGSVPVSSVAQASPAEYVLTTDTMNVLAAHTITVTPGAVSDTTGEKTLQSPWNTATFVSISGDETEIVNIQLQTYSCTDVTYERPVLDSDALDRMNYRVAAMDFDYFGEYLEEYVPDDVTYLGGTTYRFDHGSVSWLAGSITYFLARDIYDLTGNHIFYNYPTYFDGNLDVPYPVDTDSTVPVIDTFYLLAADGGSTIQTPQQTVAVFIEETELEGGVVRWLIREDATAPDADEMWNTGAQARPNRFLLSDGVGSHTVYAWVMDNSGNISARADATIELLDGGTSAVVSTSDPTTGEIWLEIDFLSTGSAAGAGRNIRSWFWDFGDGSHSFDSDPTHVFKIAGTYDVILRVTDDYGEWAEDSLTVTALPDMTLPEVDVPEITLTGRVDDPNCTVTVNGFPVDDFTGGTYTHRVTLSDGENTFDVIADDGANQTTLTVTVQKQ